MNFRPLKTIADLAMPILATVIIWDALERIVQILAIILLTILIVKNLGFNVNVVNKFKKSKVGKFLLLVIGSSATITRINEDYFDDTSKMIAGHIKKGGSLMKRKDIVLWLNGNKKQILSVISIILFAVEYYFRFSATLGIPIDMIYTLAAIIFVFVIWVMGGEGWTSNTINDINKKAKIAKSATKKQVVLYKSELKRINTQIDNILKYRISDVLPPDKKIMLDELTKSKNFYVTKITEFLGKIDNKELK